MDNENLEEVKKESEIINKRNFVKDEFKLIEVVIISLITIVIGIIVGYAVTTRFSLSENEKVVQNDENLQVFIDTYEDVISKYYEDVDKKELINSAISGMLTNLDDPYSVYMDSDTTSDFNDRLYGDYAGIGAEVSMTIDGKIIIYNPFENSPAKKAGLKKGDIIIKINGEDMTGKTSSDASQLIKGVAGTKVLITIERDGKQQDIEVKRGHITLDSVTYKVFTKNDKKIGYINISIFAANSYSQFRKAVLDLEEQKVNCIIIDVRNNSGGYLDSVTDMLGMFLKKDKIIYQLDEKGKLTSIKDETKESRDIKVGVLINEYSASASEILASALLESYGAEVIGVNSFGKGTVQQTKELSTGGMLKYTTQKWLTPNGNWINEKGVTPTIEEKLNDKYYETGKEEDDNQLQKAIEMLSK